MPRLDIERQQQLEPLRIQHAIQRIVALGYKIQQYDKRLEFEYKGSIVRFWPYSGWAAGKTINDGRGLKKLLQQIQDQ